MLVASGYRLLLSSAYVSTATAMVLISAIDRFCFARCTAASRFGIAIAARIPRMTMNTRPAMRTITRTGGPLLPPAARRDGAPFVGLPQAVHGANETALTGFPQ